MSKRMIEKCIEFKIRDGEVVIHGYPELENRKGVIVGDGIAFFFGEGCEIMNYT